MKNLKKYIIIAAASILTYSCNDALDIQQPGQPDDTQAFKTAADLEKFLVGSVYASVDNTSQIKYSSLFTDELKVGPSNAGQDQSTFRFIITPDDPFVEGIWGGQYLIINRVNQLIDKSALITPTSTADIALFNNTMAEARVLRAFAYLNLMTYYSTNMKDGNALGVILADKIYPLETQLPRVKNSDIWNFVEADLAFADTNLNTSAPTHVAPYFVNKNVVNALRARMYLYRGNYTLAKQYAQNAITNSGLSLTLGKPIPTGTVGSAAWNTAFYGQTTTPTPYRKMWFDDIIGENIFSLSRPSVGGTGGNIANMYTTNNTTINGAPLWVTGLNLFANYTYTPSDIRRYAFVDPTSSASAGNYIIDKYPGKNNTPLKNDVKVFRLSEMYFILAECAAQTNDLTTAATYIKQVRDARMYTGTAVLPLYNTKADALKDILRERRVELAFEGHRYADLKRLGADAGVSIDRNASDDFLTGTPLTLSLTDHRWTLPIPASEINGNPGIQQNPGY